MSLPCVLGENGVTRIIKQPLKKEEVEKLGKSAKTILDVIKTLNWEAKQVTTKSR